MKLKKLILFQLTLFFGLAIMVACERNEECALGAAQNAKKDFKKIEVSQHSVTSTTQIIK
jgi:hypothetical protein